MNFLRRFSLFFCCALALTVAGCRPRPRYAVGDHLIPLGTSDPAQIVTVLTVDPESYRVALNGVPTPSTPVETHARTQLDADYVRVDLPVGGSWTRREDLATPTANPVTPEPTPMEAPSPPPKPTPTATPTVDFEKVAANVQPAVVLISTFDTAGKLAKSGTGFFVSADGQIATALDNIDGAVNAVAKTGTGKIYNISGLLAASPDDDLAILKADSKAVPYLAIFKDESDQNGRPAAVIPGRGKTQNASVIEGTVTVSDTDANTLQLNGKNLSGVAGAPVVNEQSEVMGIATAEESGSTLRSLRSAKALAALLKIPANTVARWPSAGSPPPSATPTPKPSPTATPRPTGNAGLIYTPQPRYPTSARFSYRPVEGSGRFLIVFDKNGIAAAVQTVQSTGSDALDNAALDALRQWRARPGAPSQRTVPITFIKPR